MANFNTAYFSNVQSNGTSEETQEVREVCIANISPRERQKRLQFAIQQFMITIVILAVMIGLHLNPIWRLALFFLFSASTVSYFQTRDKT